MALYILSVVTIRRDHESLDFTILFLCKGGFSICLDQLNKYNYEKIFGDNIVTRETSCSIFVLVDIERCDDTQRVDAALICHLAS